MDERCVFCRRQPIDPKWRPFCSQRCQLQDLARWADGSYSVPAEPAAGADRPGPGNDDSADRNPDDD
jgi:endogenous inhibitor of DNA gyrase (YacG/DUF329 family)